MAKNIDIPNGWEVKKLGEVVEINNTRVLTEKLEPLSISAGIGFVNQTEKFGRDLSGKQYEKYIKIQKYDFAYNKGNSKKYPQGCVYLLKDREYAAIPNVFECFRIKKHNCFYYEQLFISGYLNKQLFRLINAGVRNDGLLNINSENFYSCYIPVPPLAEQEKIAEILSLWDKAIEQTKELIAYKEKQKKGLMQNLLTGKKRLHGFTDKWKTVKLGEVCEYQNGDSNEENIINNGNYLLITLNSIDINGRLKKEHKRINQGKPILYKNDIVMILSDIAHGFLLGLSAVIDENNKYILNQRVGLLRPKKQINSLFLSYLINLNQLYFKKHGQGSSQLNLSKGDIINFQLYIPLNIEEQNFIVKTISKADEEIELLNKQLDLYTEQKKGLMQNLLTGKVRVTV